MRIEITNLGKTHGSFRALGGIQLSIGPGLFGLLGPNGAGKTTLMQILATLQPPTEGEATIGGYRLGRDDQAIRGLLGYLPQELDLYKKLTGYECLDHAALMKGFANARRRREAVNELLECVNMTEHAGKRTAVYSVGMKRRIGIAQALLGWPRLIIADEPTAWLDLEERIRLRELLKRLGEERTVILSTHQVADIEKNCSGLAILKQGRLAYSGTREALLDRVKGRVWAGLIDESRLEALKLETTPIGVRKAIHGYEVRVLADDCPFEGAARAQAGLEDAYQSITQTEVSNP